MQMSLKVVLALVSNTVCFHMQDVNIDGLYQVLILY